MPLRFICPTNTKDRNQLVVDYLTSERAAVSDQVRNDKQLALTIEPVRINPAGSETLYSPDHLSTDTFQVAVGLADGFPTSGTFTMTAGTSTPTTTSPIAYNVTDGSLEVTLTAIFETEGANAPIVSEIAEGVFELIGSDDGAIATGFLSGDGSGLFPQSTVFVNEEDLGDTDRPYKLLVIIRQSPMCYAAPSTQLPATDVDIEDVQAQSATANRIQRIFFDQPDTYGGRYSITITVDGIVVTVVARPGMTADELGALLGSHPLVNYNRPDYDDNISIERLTDDDGGVSFVVSWIGNLAPIGILSSSIEADTTSVITTLSPHGYTSGHSYTIASHGGTPTVDGARIVTVLSDTTFSIPVDVTVVGSGGTVRPTNAPGLAVANIDLVGPKGVSGEINLNTIALYKYSRTQTSQTFDLLISITRTRVSGERKTIFGPTAITIDKDLVDPTTMIQTDFGDYYTSAAVDALLLNYARQEGRYKANDQSRSATTTPAADSDLTVAIAANEVWAFELFLLVQSASITPGWKGGMSFPTSPTAARWTLDYFDHDGGTAIVPRDADSGTETGIALGVTTSIRINIRGMVINGSNAGNLALHWSQNVSNATAVVVQQGSYMIATKLN